MTGISTGVGLISGLNFVELVDVIINAQRGGVRRMEDRIKGFESTSTGLSALEATILSINTSIQRFSNSSTFESFTVQNSDEPQLAVKTTSNAQPGTYQFQAIRKAATHQLLSKGFADTDSQTLGAGTITIATGGRLDPGQPLDSLNEGAGVRRGVIRLTDRSGQTADVDLSAVFTVQEVLRAINQAENLSITASVSDGQLILTDTSGASAANLSVTDLNAGHAAEDLGIEQSVAADTLAGSTTFSVTGDFSLDQINDGNRLDRSEGAPDLRITLTDDSTLEVNLDDAETLGDVIGLINDHVDNAGRVSAALVNGRIELSDLTGGGGGSALAVEDVNNASVVRPLGLDAVAVGTTLIGSRLVAGLGSVLLRNVNGGQGVDQTGQITLTDRAGESATIDLSGAESLEEVINAINAAESAGGVKLQLVAELDDLGTGLRIRDTSGASASNLIIADVGGGTLASDLGLAVDSAETSVESGSLKLRYVNAATSLADYAPDGAAVSTGSFLIRDSAGNAATITVSSTVKTVGDVIERINSASGIAVTAELNENGDGFVLIDEAAGAGALTIEGLGGNAAGDLRLTGTAFVGGDGKARIESRKTVVIDLAAEDTLDDLIGQLGTYSGSVTASVFNDGSAFNSQRLLIDSAQAGANGRLIIDTGGLDLGLDVVTEAQDALLSVNSFGSLNFLRASTTNVFEDAAPGVEVTINQPGEAPAVVTVARDNSAIESAITSFVTAYNAFVSASDQLTAFDLEANQKGVLQGSGTVLRVSQRLDSLVTRRIESTNQDVRSLLDLGVRFDTGGKLTFDADVFQDRIAAHPEAVSDFFLAKTTGFGAVADSVLDSLTDPFTGTFSIERESLDQSIGALTTRIDELDAILAVRRQRLLQEFIQMETILGTLTSQQQALSTIAPLQVLRSNK